MSEQYQVPEEPRINVEVAKTTRGYTWKAKVSYAVTAEQAVLMVKEAMSKLEAEYSDEE